MLHNTNWTSLRGCTQIDNARNDFFKIKLKYSEIVKSPKVKNTNRPNNNNLIKDDPLNIQLTNSVKTNTLLLSKALHELKTNIQDITLLVDFANIIHDEARKQNTNTLTKCLVMSILDNFASCGQNVIFICKPIRYHSLLGPRTCVPFFRKITQKYPNLIFMVCRQHGTKKIKHDYRQSDDCIAMLLKHLLGASLITKDKQMKTEHNLIHCNPFNIHIVLDGLSWHSTINVSPAPQKGCCR